MSSMTPKQLLQDPITWVGGSVGVLILVSAGYWIFAPKAGEASKTLEQGYTHLHCPTCKFETPYNTSQVGKPCQSCVVGSPLVATKGSLKSNEGSGSGQSMGRIIGYALLVCLVCEGVWLLGAWRFRTLRNAEEQRTQRTLICRCPHCRQKMRFPALHQGNGALCSRCKATIVLEPETETVES